METTVRERLRELAAGELRAQLARRRVSAAELARRLGWKQSYMARRIDGRVALDLDDMEDIAEVLGIEVSDLLPRRAAGHSGNEPNDRLDAIKKTDGRRNPKRWSSRPNKRPAGAPTRPVSTIPPNQRRPNPVRPGERRMAA